MTMLKINCNLKTCLGTSSFRISVNSSSFFSLVIVNNMGVRNFAYKYKYNLPYNNGKTYTLPDGRIIHYEQTGPRGVSDLNKPEHIGKVIAALKPLVVKTDCGVGIFSPQFKSIQMLFEERFDVFFTVKKYVELLKKQLGHDSYRQMQLNSGLHFGFPGYKLNDRYFFDIAQLVDSNYSLPIVGEVKPNIKSYMAGYTEDHLNEIRDSIMVCFIKSETEAIERDCILTSADSRIIKEYLTTVPLIGTGSPEAPQFERIICSIDFIKESIMKICQANGFKCVYGRFNLDSEPGNRVHGLRYVKLHPDLVEFKTSKLNDETNTSEDNDNY